jgi:hypothetical protein
VDHRRADAGAQIGAQQLGEARGELNLAKQVVVLGDAVVNMIAGLDHFGVRKQISDMLLHRVQPPYTSNSARGLL